MKLLALETATDNCSVAVGDAERQWVVEERAPRRHAELLLPMVDTALDRAGWRRQELDAIAFGRGPGSFTGLRVAVSAAQGIALGLDLPVAGVSSLAAMAQAAAADRIATALDARLNQVYFGAYRRDGNGLVRAITADRVVDPQAVALPGEKPWLAVGPGWDAYADDLTPRLASRIAGTDPTALPSAREILILGLAIAERGDLRPADEALPVYLRNRVVHRQEG